MCSKLDHRKLNNVRIIYINKIKNYHFRGKLCTLKGSIYKLTKYFTYLY